MLTLLVVLNGLTLLVLIWIAIRVSTNSSSHNDISVLVEQIVDEVKKMQVLEEHTIKRLYETIEVLEKNQEQSLKAYQLREALSDELSDVLKLASFQKKHLDQILDDVKVLYREGASDEEQWQKLREHPYHRSEEVSEWLDKLGVEHDSRALANNVRRLLDADTREGDWTSQRAEVEKRLEKLEKSINLLEPEDYWCLDSERFEGIEPQRECRWLRFALDDWLGGKDVGSPPTHFVWEAPINGETFTQFSEKVSEDAEELRQSEARLIAGLSDAD